MPPNTDKASIHAQLRPLSKTLGGHFFLNLWHKLGTENTISTGFVTPRCHSDITSKSHTISI